jgi:membrane dipeptidase
MNPVARRDFLQLTVAALSVPGALAGSAAAVAEAPGSGHWADAIIVNALGGLEDPNPKPSDERVMREAHASGLTAVNLTLGYVFGDGDPFETTVRDIAKTDSQVRADGRNLLKVWTAADILRARTEGKIGLIYGFQNATMLGNDASRVEVFAGLGVRVIQLTYNGANPLGDGSMVPENRGLTPFGHAVVDKLNDNRIMVDLSHSGQRICLDAARASKQPISINHTGCRALVDVPRNKTDEELRLVASKGGFVGIYFMPFLNKTSHATADDVVAHIDHAVNVCGEDAVGIGTDGSVTAIDDLKGYMEVLAEEHEGRVKAGISAPGEGPDTVPFVVNLRGVNQFYELADRLQKQGYSATRVEKILGRNFVRYARDVWGG